MSEVNNGGPAFPRPATKDQWGIAQNGMTLRDYFAAKALCLGGEFFHNYANGCSAPEHMAAVCYEISDAMLKSRKPIDEEKP